jgi:hypothetical protein
VGYVESTRRFSLPLRRIRSVEKCPVAEPFFKESDPGGLGGYDASMLTPKSPGA